MYSGREARARRWVARQSDVDVGSNVGSLCESAERRSAARREEALRLADPTPAALVTLGLVAAARSVSRSEANRLARRAASSSLSRNRLLGTRTRAERAPSLAVASASTPFPGSAVEAFIATALTTIAGLALFRPSCRGRSRDSLAVFFGLTTPRAASESSTTSPSLARRPVVVVVATAPFPTPASTRASSPSSFLLLRVVFVFVFVFVFLFVVPVVVLRRLVVAPSFPPDRSRASPSSTTTSARTSSMRSFLATSVPRRRAPSLAASSSNDAHM